MREVETDDQRERVLSLYREHRKLIKPGRLDIPRRMPNFCIRYTQQDAVGVVRTGLAAAQRAGDLLEAGVAKSGCKRRTHAARAHDHAVAGKR